MLLQAQFYKKPIYENKLFTLRKKNNIQFILFR